MTEKPSRNEDEYFVRLDAELMKQRRAEMQAASAQAERISHYMKCPKDGYDLESRDFHGVMVEICSHCHGMWLDAGELDLVAQHDDHPGLIGRVFGDVLSSLRGRQSKEQQVRHAPGNPLA